ncbi:hypothetical protein Chor_003923, partial [Crotalus horridus]
NCTSPVPPPHSTLKEDPPKKSYPVGTNLTYHCITGKKCPAPIIENGKVDAEDDVRLGGSVTFSCVPGFRLIGEATRKCILKDGKVDWNSALPHCEHIPCERPVSILNGQYDPDPKDEYYVGSVVIYRCKGDFSLIGNSTITCITAEDGVNGRWNFPAPECKQVKCDRPKVENGKITNLPKPSYIYNEAISFECNSGYSAMGSLHIKCGANSSWVPAIPKCVKDNCTSPVLPPHSTLKEDIPKEGYPVGTNLTYHCITGYEYIPGINPSVTCLNTSKWTEISELCQGKKCPAPIIENGKVDAEDDVRLGGSVTFSCVPGFRLIGEATRKCILKDGKVDWNSALPHCEHIPCERPVSILNGQYDPDPKDEYYVGSVVIYRCKGDFSLIGNSTITCITAEDGVNGRWNFPAPECKQVKCDQPEVENGKITNIPKPSYTYNEAISIECNSGYSAVGSLHIKCGANSTWVPATPKCVKEKPNTTSKDYAECNRTTAL